MKLVRLLLLLAAVQLALWLGWRTLNADDPPLGAVDRPLPALTVFDAADRAAPLPDGPLVLHIWATWCPPCRDELPDLLRFAAASPVPVLAVATDPDWRAIRGFVGDPLSPALRRASARAVADGLDVQTLPVTFVVRDGRLVARIDGARDWSDPALRRAVLAAAR